MLPFRYDPSSPTPSPWPTGEDVADPQGPGFRAWIPDEPLLVLGNSQTPETELHLDNVRADGIPVYQRKGGGGAVLLTEGCVCLALRFRKRSDWGIHDYFKEGNRLVSRVVRDAFGIDTALRGSSDLAVSEKKISGASMYMPRHCALYLASILVNVRMSDWDRHLRHPSREPDYRGGRTHGEFVVNLAELNPEVTAEQLRKAVETEVTTLPREWMGQPQLP
jgi:lipoate-protein ligase A